MTLYEILEIDPSSTADEIKIAYRRASMKFHPDKPSGDTEMFKKITDAYTILSNEQKRKYYDASLKTYVQGEIILDTADLGLKTDIKMGRGIVEVRRVFK